MVSWYKHLPAGTYNRAHSTRPHRTPEYCNPIISMCVISRSDPVVVCCGRWRRRSENRAEYLISRALRSERHTLQN